MGQACTSTVDPGGQGYHQANSEVILKDANSNVTIEVLSSNGNLRSSSSKVNIRSSSRGDLNDTNSETNVNNTKDTISMVTCREVSSDVVGAGGSNKEGGVWVIYDVITSPSFKLLDDPNIIASFSCFCDIHSICPTSIGEAWTCDMFSKDLTLLDKNGHVLQRVSCRTFIDDVTLSDDKHETPYFLCTRRTCVMTWDPSSEKAKLKFVTEKKPSCLCYIGKDRLVVGMKHKVIMYTTDGDVVWESTTLDSGIICPWRITMCPVTGNLALVDMDLLKYGGQGKANVLVTDNSLKPLFRYRGKGTQMKTTSLFEPCDVAFDSHGNLVIACYTSHTIELVSAAGDHLKTLHTDTGNIQAIGIQKGGKGGEDILWAVFYYTEDEEEMDQIKLFQYYS